MTAMVTALAIAMIVYGVLLVYDCVLQAYRVGPSMRNLSLAIIGAVAVVLYGLVLAGPLSLSGAAGWLGAGLSVLAAAFTLGFICYLVATVVLVCRRPCEDWCYVVVLGAGLTNGRYPSRLLRGRLDAGMDWWRHPGPSEGAPLRAETPASSESRRYLVVCGGQGPDEKVPEAQAMREYLLEHGVPADRIIVEDQSRTTWENLANARGIIAAREGIASDVGAPSAALPVEDNAAEPDDRSLIVTSNFHAVRTTLWARQVGIRFVGVIGKHTRIYYLVGALVRDYLALSKGYRRATAAIVVGCLVLGAAFSTF